MTYSPIDLYTLAELRHRDPDAALRIADESARETDEAVRRAIQSADELVKDMRSLRMAAMFAGELRRLG